MSKSSTSIPSAEWVKVQLWHCQMRISSADILPAEKKLAALLKAELKFSRNNVSWVTGWGWPGTCQMRIPYFANTSPKLLFYLQSHTIITVHVYYYSLTTLTIRSWIGEAYQIKVFHIRTLRKKNDDRVLITNLLTQTHLSLYYFPWTGW